MTQMSKGYEGYADAHKVRPLLPSQYKGTQMNIEVLWESVVGKDFLTTLKNKPKSLETNPDKYLEYRYRIQTQRKKNWIVKEYNDKFFEAEIAATDEILRVLTHE